MREQLTELKMKGALEVLDDFLEKKLDNGQFGAGILKAEIFHRKQNAAMKRIKRASFPYAREWEQIKQEWNPMIPFDALKKFSSGDFLQGKKNLCFIGLPGVGKTHSLISIGRDLCRNQQNVLFFTATDLVTQLEEAKSKNELSRFKDRIRRANLLIIDELGFVPFSDNGARLLFDVFTSRYQVGSIAISTNLAFEKWTQIFGALELTTALIDRFTHNCEIFVFDGDSARLRQAKEKMKEKPGQLKKK